jgi:hypothetical protein
VQGESHFAVGSLHAEAVRQLQLLPGAAGESELADGFGSGEVEGAAELVRRMAKQAALQGG